MNSISETLRLQVAARAGGRCEYCRLSQLGQEAVFHIDHVHPRALGGETTTENLALACVSCSLRKGARAKAIDPSSRRSTAIFNPRRDRWDRHFAWRGVTLVGRTAKGRATIELLQMNRPVIFAIRGEERLHGRHPE